MPGYRKEDLVDNTIVRGRVLCSGIPIKALARNMGVHESSFRRAIGMNIGSHRKYQKNCSRNMAIKIYRAIGYDPIDVGL